MKKVGKPDPRDGWYEIGPSDAQALLENRIKNRPLSEHGAKVIAQSIENGFWEPNGETFILDQSGRLLDGQTRARGIVLANRPVVAYVVHGVQPKAFDSIDQGTARTAAHIAAIMGTKHYALAAAVAGWALKYETDWTINNIRIPNREIRVWLTKNSAECVVAIEEMAGFAPNYQRAIIPSVLGFVYYMARRQNAKKAGMFVVGVASGESLGSGSPMLALRNRLASAKASGGKVNRHHAMSWAIKAWNAFLQDRKLGLIKHVVKKGGAGEGLPRIGEADDPQ